MKDIYKAQEEQQAIASEFQQLRARARQLKERDE